MLRLQLELVSNFSDISPAKTHIDSRVGFSAKTLHSNMMSSGDDNMTSTTVPVLVPVRQGSENLRAFAQPAFFHPLKRVHASIEKTL